MADPGFPRGGGANSPGGGAPTYDFAKFSQKLHEIERIWAPRGGASLAPPLDPPLWCSTSSWCSEFLGNCKTVIIQFMLHWQAITAWAVKHIIRSDGRSRLNLDLDLEVYSNARRFSKKQETQRKVRLSLHMNEVLQISCFLASSAPPLSIWRGCGA